MCIRDRRRGELEQQSLIRPVDQGEKVLECTVFFGQEMNAQTIHQWAQETGDSAIKGKGGADYTAVHVPLPGGVSMVAVVQEVAVLGEGAFRLSSRA